MSKRGTQHDDLVRRAEEVMRRLRKSKQRDEEAGRTQASRALAVAQDSDSLRLFLNWLRYQAAREADRQRFWSASLQKGTLAEAVADELKAIAKEAAEDTMVAVRYFLGYFRRALIGEAFLDRITLEE